MKKRNLALKQHKSEIWKNKNGYVTYVPDENKAQKRRQISCRTYDGLVDKILAHYKTQEENPTIEEIFISWNDTKLRSRQIAENTHLRNQQLFNKHYTSIKHKKIKSLTPKAVEKFLEEQLYNHHLKSKAFSNLKTITRGILITAKKELLINFNLENVLNDMEISPKSFKKNTNDYAKDVYTKEETHKIMKYLSEHQTLKNLSILLMFVSGVRVGELVALKHEDIKNNVLTVKRTEIKVPKRNGGNEYIVRDCPKTEAGERYIVVPPDYEWVLETLQQRTAATEYIFTESGHRLTTNSIRKYLEKLCNQLGIPYRSPHKIRKTYASILLDNLCDERFILNQMGHTDIGCTNQHYYRFRKNYQGYSQTLATIPEFQKNSG